MIILESHNCIFILFFEVFHQKVHNSTFIKQYKNIPKVFDCTDLYIFHLVSILCIYMLTTEN